MYIETLKHRLREVPLPQVEAHQVKLDELLLSIIDGDENPRDLQVELFVALQQARGRVLLGDFIAVMRGEYNDALYLDLTLAFQQFGQSDRLKHVQGKKLPAGRAEMRHLFTVLAAMDVAAWCQENLEPAELELLDAEAADAGKERSAWVQEYLSGQIRKQ
jgi:hypothetical protein